MNFQMNIQIEMPKDKAVECFEIKPGQVKSCQASSMQLITK